MSFSITGANALDTRNTGWEQCKKCKCYTPKGTHCACNCRDNPTLSQQHEQREAQREKMIGLANERRRFARLARKAVPA